VKIASMLSDVFGSIFRKPFTELYPFATRAAPARLRGKLLWDPVKCRGCMLCMRDCPAQAIVIEVADRAAKRYIFHYHLDRCIYCAQCVASCRDGALSMSNELYHLAARDKTGFIETYRSEGSHGEPPAGSAR
jgi:formate hydrogenlyase subunit 6/NADH:ubiquinone oxidoreductase subunit I